MISCFNISNIITNYDRDQAPHHQNVVAVKDFIDKFAITIFFVFGSQNKIYCYVSIQESYLDHNSNTQRLK